MQALVSRKIRAFNSRRVSTCRVTQSVQEIYNTTPALEAIRRGRDIAIQKEGRDI